MNKYLKDCKCVGLDGVIAQQNNYKKSGFVFAPHDNKRHHIDASLLKGKASTEGCVLVEKGNEKAIDDCVAFDKLVFSELDRKTFLKNFLTKLQDTVLVVCYSSNELQGYGKK